MKNFFTKRARVLSIVLALMVLTSVTAFAASRTVDLTAVYRNIQVYVNGTQITPTDGNGNATEPFIVDGTTYLPVRAVSEALGYDVEWDGATSSVYIGARPDDLTALYRAAVTDAMVISDNDIYPLVEISATGDMVSWDDEGRVLMVTFHRFPDSYVAGEEYVLVWGDVWTFTDREIAAWYRNNNDDVTDWTLRFKQLIGLPYHREYTHFSGFWAHPNDIIRPAYAWRLSDTTGAAEFTEEPAEEFQEWFNGNIIWSYFDSAFPWTRLGYTYDWAAGGSNYGLSEFLVRKDAVTLVEFTLTVDEFVDWLESQ
jgi:hypothetical protein